MPKGWALATIDFTIKMTGVAKGEKLRAKGRVCRTAGPIRLARPTFIACRAAKSLMRDRARDYPKFKIKT